MATLAETPLPRLLMGLARDGFAGALTLRYGNTRRTFRWEGGRPVAVESSRPEDSLTALLVERGTIDESAAARVRASAIAREKGELMALAAAKLGSPKDLLMGYAEQIRRGLVESFGWPPEAECSFEHQAGESGAPPIPVDVAEIVRAGLARHWRPDQVFEELGERITAFPTARESEEPADDVCQELLVGCDGTRTSFSILRASASPEQLAAFWWLDATGRLAWSDEATASDDAAETEPEGVEDEAPVDLGPEIEIVLTGASDAAAASSSALASDEVVTTVNPKTEALRAEILDLNGRLGETTYYELLSIERDAAAGQVKKAYLKAAKRLHPDALSRVGLDDVMDEANSVFAEITKAHSTLSNPDDRASYDAALDGHTAIDADQLAQAELLFRKGEILMKAGNFIDAYELLDATVSLWPEEAEYHAALAWCLQRKTPPDSPASVRHFERALELGDPTAQLLLRMSFAVKDAGDPKRGAELARDAKQLDPSVRA